MMLLGTSQNCKPTTAVLRVPYAVLHYCFPLIYSGNNYLSTPTSPDNKTVVLPESSDATISQNSFWIHV